MQELFKAIQEAASSSAWSRGVELVRTESVTGEPGATPDANEVLLRVSTRGGLEAPLVTLYLEDEDWECTCKGNEDPCQHVAAAVIALRQARKAGHALPQPSRSTGVLHYRLYLEVGDELAIEREIVSGDERYPLTATLEAIASGRVRGPRFSATQQDLQVEHVLGAKRRGALARETIPRLVDKLAGHPHVFLDGRPITVSAEPVLPVAHVVDAPGGVRLYLEQDETITHVFKNGAVLCGDTLRAPGSPRLSGRELAELPRGRFYPNDQLAELVTEVLPSLGERIPISVETTRLPRTSESEAPRIVLEVGREDDHLTVLATLVYGDPPCARIDAGRLVHIRGSIPIRDEAEERMRLRHLQQTLELLPGRRVSVAGAEAIGLAERLARWPGEIRGDAHHHFHALPELLPRLRVEGERLDLEFEIPAGDGAAGGALGKEAGSDTARRSAGVPAQSVIDAWQAGDGWVSVSGGGFAPLPTDWLERFGPYVADLLSARREDGTLPTCMLPDLGALCEELEMPPPARLEKLAPVLEDFSGIAPTALPADLTGELRGYQRRGVDWLAFLREAELGALLADDMGLGKTLQALCVLDGRSLVVAPTSVLHNWADEMARFRPSLRFSLYHGPRRELDPEASVILTSYAILRLDVDALARERWDTVVLDEAQNIKNAESQVAQAAFRLEAGFRIALTGTPVENRLEELWSQFHFLNRGLLGGRREFQERYARPIAAGEPIAAGRLRTRIHPFVLRRLKSQVATELPPRTEIVLHCELSEEEQNVYDAVRAASVEQVVAQLRQGGSVMAALEALLRLRQACCHPALVPGRRDKESAESAKISLLVERLEQAVEDGHKALVFSQWTSFLNLIEPHLRAAGIEFTRLDGATRDRAGTVGSFQTDTGPPVMLVSLKAGGTGLNLTAADHIFLMDPWWNPAVEDQAADRAHRIGQTRPVVVHRIVAQNTVEERILELHARKRELTRVAIEGVGAAEGLTREDLMGLLAD